MNSILHFKVGKIFNLSINITKSSLLIVIIY